MKKVLITGGAGFIGSHLAKKLIGQNWSVVIIDRLNSSNVELKKARMKNLLPKKGYTFYDIDLSETQKLKNIFKKNKFDIICHLAAKTNLKFDSELYNKTNILGTIGIFELAKKYQVPKVIFASSSMVYGNNAKKPFSENDPTDHPLSIYAVAKKSDEILAYTYHHLHGINMVGLRFFTTYGPWSRTDMAVTRFTEQIAQGKTIKIQNQGRIKKDFTYIDDLVDGLIAAINKNLKYEIINLGSGKAVSIKTIVRLIENNLGKKALIEYVPKQAGDITETKADIRKAGKILNYHPKVSIEEGMKKYIAWFKNK